MLRITPWERGMLEQLARGVATKDIARRWGMDEPDVESRLRMLFARMGVTSASEAVAAAARRGLVAPDRFHGRIIGVRAAPRECVRARRPHGPRIPRGDR
jgi:DNA-binding CsgD family transcriptional regulator